MKYQQTALVNVVLDLIELIIYHKKGIYTFTGLIVSGIVNNHGPVEHGSRVCKILLIKWGMAETNNKIWHDEDKRKYRDMINSDSGASF